MNTLHVVLPNDIDDPTTPSGGNVYDRRLCDGLSAAGWSVREYAVPGTWPHPSPSDRTGLWRVLADIADDALVLLDGLIACAVPEVVEPHAQRLRLAVVVHMPLGSADGNAAAARTAEGRVLWAAQLVVTTSEWTRRRLMELYDLPPARVHVAAPGVDGAALGTAAETGSRLLYVAALTPHKGHDLLVQALSAVPDPSWTCVCVGSLDRDPTWAAEVRRQAEVLGDRIQFVGPRTGETLAEHYRQADLLVLASRAETYGMVVTEALARGVPVLATAVGGLPEALGAAPDGSVPGVLVGPDDADALAAALRQWLSAPSLRRDLRNSARLRRKTLTDWTVTTRLVSNALSRTSTKVSAGR